jgi:hypothetical protein
MNLPSANAWVLSNWKAARMQPTTNEVDPGWMVWQFASVPDQGFFLLIRRNLVRFPLSNSQLPIAYSRMPDPKPLVNPDFRGIDIKGRKNQILRNRPSTPVCNQFFHCLAQFVTRAIQGSITQFDAVQTLSTYPGGGVVKKINDAFLCL